MKRVLLVLPFLVFAKLAMAGDGGLPLKKIIAMHSNRCLNVTYESYQPGMVITQWDCLPQQNERFEMIPVGDYYMIRSAQTNQCLSVNFGDASNFATIVQWPCHGDNNQLVKLDPVDGREHVFKVLFKHSGRCMDIVDSKRNNGAQLIQFSCNDGENQHFNFADSVN